MESVLFGTMPGALMFRRSYPIGVPDMHSPLSAHLSVVADAPVFAGIPDAERDGLFESLTKTLRRSDYHRLRYADLRQALDERRADLPGYVF